MPNRERLAVLVFQGGASPATPIEGDLRRIREAATLDLLQLLLSVAEIDVVRLVTDRPALAEAARRLGAEAVASPSGAAFHFGRCLRRQVLEGGWARVIVLGGASAPLLGRRDFAGLARRLRQGTGICVLNNPVSPDVVGFAPAEALREIAPPASDNQLGEALRAVGLRQLLMRNAPRVNFDLDTPTDCAVLAGEAGVGPTCRRALGACSWLPPLAARLERVTAVMARPGAELALIGRVGPPLTERLAAHLPCRLRLFSEERGMRALGRDRDGLAETLVGRLLDEVGPEAFFEHLAAVADAAVFDTRVVMARWRRPLSDGDRFASDAGLAGDIADPQLARLTAAAGQARLPLVLGGHTLVYGGLWLLARRAAVRRPPVSSPQADATAPKGRVLP